MRSLQFEDFARATLGGASNISDKSPLSNSQIERITIFLASPASGPDGSTSYAEFLASKLKDFPPELSEGKDYIAFSGEDRNGNSNYDNAIDYIEEVKNKAGIIGNTPWGNYINDTEKTPGNHPEFAAMEKKLKAFMDGEGVTPWKNDHAGALRDMMWNAGSPKFFENAIATGKPLVAFVDGAPANRGFSNFELTTALDHPDVRINGYPVSAFGPDPLAFARNSAAEYQQLERAVAQQAKANSGRIVEVTDIQRNSMCSTISICPIPSSAETISNRWTNWN